MMSSRYNYLGIGLGYRWPDGATYASIVFAEMPDHSRPSVKVTSAGRTGTSVWFRYSGTDALLQTHTAGMRDYDIAYRVDNGSWTIIRLHRIARSITFSSRAHGHTYYIAVRARDRVGNVSSWSAPAHVTVP